MDTTASLGVTRILADDASTSFHGTVEDELPESIGRYRVLGRLGAGGMGEVFTAHDPKLDRKVALKLVRPREGEDPREAGARLHREAQALARLTHPHVVPVFDTGVHGRRVFVAMELVDGQTLRRWNQARGPDWREVLRVLLEAGRGLAAAHQAGVIHRDFKPSNVMVGADGRARVLDFGLARYIAEPSDSLESAGSRAPRSYDSQISGSESLTEAGVILGTPSYMAPEQFLGADVDAKSDQFAFCVTAYSMFYGQRPFVGDGFRALRASVLEDRPEPPPRSSSVPAEIWRALRRGLRRAPEERWDDMGQLMAALERGTNANRRRLLGAAVGLAALLGGTVAVGGTGTSDRCQEIATRGEDTWGDARRASLRDAFTRTELPYAAASWEEVDHRLSNYVDRWVEARTQTCDAVVDGARRTDPGIDHRIACLERSLQSATALVERFEEGGPRIVEHAPEALRNLPSLARCARVGDEPRSELADPRLAVRVAALQQELDSIDARLRVHPDESVLAAVQSVARRAETLGHRPLIAETQRMLGRAHSRDRDYEAARLAHEAAVQTSAEAGDVRGEVLARLELIRLLSDRLIDNDSALDQARATEALLARLGDDPLLSARLAQATGSVYLEAGDLDEAEKRLRAVLERDADRRELESVLASARSSLAITLSRRGRYEESIELMKEEIAAIDRLVGPDHPRMARALGNIGSSLSNMGRIDEAETAISRGIDVYTRAAGEKARGLETLLHNLAILRQQQGRSDEAVATLERAIALAEENRDPDDSGLGWMHNDMGTLLFMVDQVEECIPHLEDAVRIFEAGQGDDAPGLVYTLGVIIQAYMRVERPAEATPHVERALALIERQEVDPAGAAMVRFAASRSLWETGGQPERARRLAREAITDLRRSERKVPKQLEAMEEWAEEIDPTSDPAPDR